MKKGYLFFYILITALCSKAQEFENVSPARMQVHEKDISLLSQLEILEDSLVFMADSMYFSQINESRVSGSYEFIRIFKKLLREPNSFSAPFKKLKEKMTILDAPDKTFRIYNWEIVRSGVERRYYGAIQTSLGENFPLVDLSDQIIRGVADSTFTNAGWYGNLYYNMTMKEAEGQKYYFLFGWNGNSMNSNRKMVDVLSFDRNRKVVFGSPIFNLIERGKQVRKNRLVLEYEKSAKVFLNYDPDTDQIIFDHCESQIGDPAKKYTFIPDGTYDGLRWNGHEWVMNENVVQITILKDGEAPVDKAIIK